MDGLLIDRDLMLEHEQRQRVASRVTSSQASVRGRKNDSVNDAGKTS
jgi:hypothetical protein